MMENDELSVRIDTIKSDIERYEKFLSDYPNKKLIIKPLSDGEFSILLESVTLPIDKNGLFNIVKQRIYELYDELTKLKGDN